MTGSSPAASAEASTDFPSLTTSAAPRNEPR